MQLAASQGVECQGTELTLRFEDGRERQIYGNATPLRDEDGTIYGAISAFIDITELKQAEESIRASEERFRLASEAVSGVIYQWDLGSGRVERSAGLSGASLASDWTKRSRPKRGGLNGFILRTGSEPRPSSSGARWSRDHFMRWSTESGIGKETIATSGNGPGSCTTPRTIRRVSLAT